MNLSIGIALGVTLGSGNAGTVAITAPSAGFTLCSTLSNTLSASVSANFSGTARWKDGSDNVLGSASFAPGASTVSASWTPTDASAGAVTITCELVTAGGRVIAVSPGVSGTVLASPAAFAGLMGWWDPSTASTLTMSGSNVAAIADRSGSGNALTPSGGVGYGLAAWGNGLSALNGTKTGDPCFGYRPASSTLQPKEIIIAAKHTGSLPGAVYDVLCNTAEAVMRIAPGASAWENGGYPRWIDDPATLSTGTKTVTNSAHIYGWSYNSTTPGIVSLGGLGANQEWPGLIGECVAYSGTLTAPNRAKVCSWLKAKWGTP